MMDDIFFEATEQCQCGAEMEVATIECYKNEDDVWMMKKVWQCPQCGAEIAIETEDE